MTISFRLPGAALERIAFAYSPLLEALLSLHVLVEPKHHPAQHTWVRQMRRLPAALRRELAAFRFLYVGPIPGFVLSGATGEYASFEDELVRLSHVEPALARLELVHQLYPRVEPAGRYGIDSPRVRETLLRLTADYDARYGAASHELIPLALAAPERVIARFAQLMRDYWETAFEAEWERIEPLLAQAVEDAGRRLAADGFFAFAAELWPEVRADSAAETISVQRPHEHRVEIGEDQSFVLTPSMYVWPHVRVSCDAPWPLGLVYAAPAVRAAARGALPPEDLLRLLRALSDDTRLRALRLIAERPRSTQELAPLVGVSESALSKHLGVMAGAGLLRTRRDGYYVLYELVAERYERLTSGLASFLRDR